MTDIFLARQPIFDRYLNVTAYELLYRQGEGDGPAEAKDADVATSTVITNTFMEFGLRSVTSGLPAYINLTRRFLVSEQIPFPKDQVVLQLQEDIEPDRELITAVRRLYGQGYRIALKDRMLQATAAQRLLPYATVVKVNTGRMSAQETVRQVRTLRRSCSATLLAENVESERRMDLCRSAGFERFQGLLLSRPATFSRRSIESSRLPLLKVIATLHKTDFEVDELERIIAQDMSLTYRLLRYLASPLFPDQEINSIRSAIVYLGRRQLANWAVLLTLTTTREQPSERIVALLVRARVCERLTQNRYGGSDSGAAFTIGLFSGLDAFLDTPLRVVCDELPLSPEARQALLEHKGPYGRVLAAALAQEEGDWDRLRELEVPPSQVNHFYLEAVRWADEQWIWLRRSSADPAGDRPRDKGPSR